MSLNLKLRSIAKSLPSPIQRGLQALNRRYHLSRDRIDLARERPFRRFDGRHVAVVGFFSAGTGISRAAEFVSLTLEGRGSRVTRVDISPAIRRHVLNIPTVKPTDCYDLDVSDVVFVINPGQPGISLFDRTWLLKRTIIGHWIWELEAMPPSWARAGDSFDELWAATEYLTGSIKALLPNFDRPIKVVSYAIDRDPFPKITPHRRNEVRISEGVAPATFVVGYSFAVGSNYLRKNPEDAVQAFQQAFPTQDAMLFLRSNDIGQWPHQLASLERRIKADRRIRLYDASRRISIHDFYAAIDCYLSPSRAEGYGLNLVEASQSGLPVITGGWRIAPEILQMPGVHVVGFDLEKVPHDPQGHYHDTLGAIWSRPRVNELSAFLEDQRKLFLAS